ncbi:MAG: hypothetical protein ACXW3Z_10635 [Limisphaerales bacterium]
MSSPLKDLNQNPLSKLAEASVEKPGMYLIALRAHLNRGKTILGDALESVADAFPKRAKAQSPADQF